MRRHGSLFNTITALANLWHAWGAFRRGKRSRPSVADFELNVDHQVVRLHRALTEGRYVPGPYRLVMIREPKRRLVAAAPVRDRIVHHAVYQVLSPLLDPGLIHTTWACLPGRGSHRALLAFMGAMRRYPWLLTLDVRHYFLSIDREILMAIMARKIKDRRLLGLLQILADSGAGIYRQPEVAEFLRLQDGFPPTGCGLPIGNLTSQWWGNQYLSGLDHFIKRELKIPHYQRYMDDMALFATSRGQLEGARQAVTEWLADHRRLRLKHPHAMPVPTDHSVIHLGRLVSRAGIRPTRQQLGRMQVRIGELLRTGDEETIQRSIASYGGVFM
ncbi:MAG: RNA-dependent DNA polymerase [Magnetococcales bacterium]|nr:RNA-dependent DNA polymerase [Magnetococcales bacterium]